MPEEEQGPVAGPRNKGSRGSRHPATGRDKSSPFSQEGRVVPGVLSPDSPTRAHSRRPAHDSMFSHCSAPVSPQLPCQGHPSAPLSGHHGCAASCHPAPAAAEPPRSHLRRGSDAEGASKMPLGAGSAASQGRQRRGLSAMTVHARQRGMVWAETVPSVAGRWPLPVRTPGRMRGTVLLPQPRVPPSRGRRTQPWPAAGLPPLGSPSTGCRQAPLLAQSTLRAGGDGECNSQLRAVPQPDRHGRGQGGMHRGTSHLQRSILTNN